MKKRKLKNAAANEGIQARNVIADVLAVGPEAKAVKKLESMGDRTRSKSTTSQSDARLSQAATSILFLSADPTDASRLRLGEELREIRERLQLAKLRDGVVLDARTSVRPGDITQALLDVMPTIVHFSGHGTASGELCVEDRLGQMKPIDPDALAALFAQFADRVRCVMLNACYSEIQATAIAEHIDYVVGMSQGIGDKAAISFATGFYQAIGAGLPIEKAYEFGCVQIRLEGIPEHLTPVLKRKPTH